MTELLNFLKSPPRQIRGLLAVVFVISGVCLLLPLEMRRAIMIEGFRRSVGTYLGVAFLGTGALLFVDLVGATLERRRAREGERSAHAMRLEWIKCLDGEEQAVLREFYLMRQNTLVLPYADPAVAGLVTKGLLVRVGDWGRGWDICLPMSIRPSVRPHLPDCVKAVDGTRLRRPEFVRERMRWSL